MYIYFCSHSSLPELNDDILMHVFSYLGLKDVVKIERGKLNEHREKRYDELNTKNVTVHLGKNTVYVVSPYSVQKVVPSCRTAVEVNQDSELQECLFLLQRKIWKYVLHLGYELLVV